MRMMHTMFGRLYVNRFRFFLILSLACCALNASQAQLPPEEVRTLQTLSSKLNIKDWSRIRPTSCENADDDFNENKYSGLTNITVVCNCSIAANRTCHVTEVYLKGLNLGGRLPEGFSNLRYLRVIDLTRNVLNGTIPISLTQLPLVSLSLLGNRLGGPIPKEIGNIRTLEELVLEDNLFSGPLPETIGNLSSLKRLLLSANNLTGIIPDSFKNLTNLADFRIDGNRLSGRIPEWVGNLKNLNELNMQGTSMQGPFPASLSSLDKLSELRISDLLGRGTNKFPDLRRMNLKVLILRNCLLNGSIPEYVGEMRNMKTLDLSFNQLSGRIPTSLQRSQLDYMFLNNNSLTGSVPTSMTRSKDNIDLSYNNFTGSATFPCQQYSVNLASSHSSGDSEWCWRKGLPCLGKSDRYLLFINCGGNRVDFEGHEYEEDLTGGTAASVFFSSEGKWAYSSTGLFMAREKADYRYQTNTTDDSNRIYETARLSPASLVYYALCLRKGNYRLRLHFSEIVFTSGDTFGSNGRRVFDVHVQGRVVLKDFNIAEEAGGFYKGIYRDFNVDVDEGTMEIQLYWAGKGTNAVPDRSVYGPLISAIAITPNFYVATGGLSGAAIAGIVVASCSAGVLVALILWWNGFFGKEIDKELQGLDLQTGYFSLRQIKAATGNFDASNKIGEGGFGPVYKGFLLDGSAVAVKQLSAKSKQGNREFVNEIGMISALQHPNLVRLYGCCIEGNQLLLVYEYMENNSLARALFGPEKDRLALDWPTRKRVCLGIARGLAYLHEESRLKIVHRDIKATNVLLDRDMTAKISDFGLAKLDEEDNTHISTRVAGTIGYIAPEYAMRGHLTDKADVYSFGVVVLEVVSGKNNSSYRPKDECVFLLDWAYVLQEQGSLLDLVDPSLGVDFDREEALRMLNLGILCANPSPTLRPTMSSAVEMLQGHAPVQPPVVVKRAAGSSDPRYRSFQTLADQSRSHITSSFDARDFRVSSSRGPWIDSSTSTNTSIKDDHSPATTAALINHR